MGAGGGGNNTGKEESLDDAALRYGTWELAMSIAEKQYANLYHAVSSAQAVTQQPHFYAGGSQSGKSGFDAFVPTSVQARNRRNP